MSHYHVTESPPGRPASRYMLLGAVAVVLALVGLPAFTTMTVTVDGDVRRIEKGAVAQDLVAEGLTDGSTGNLVAMTGEVVVEGGGGSARLVRDGRILAGDSRVHQGDALVSEHGVDVVEQQVATATPIPVCVEFCGEGPLETVTAKGEEGLALSAIGKVSGIVTPMGVPRPGVPMVIERTYPEAGDKVVALTFDDGPSPGQTEQVLEILEAEGINATFFVLGTEVEEYPALTARITQEGHQIASHGYSHRYLTSDSATVAKWEVRKATTRIVRATGERPTWFRAPGGVLSDTAREQVEAANLRIVRWDVDPQDWRQDRASKIARDTIDAVRPGSVVLLHDGGGDRANTIKALPWIIHELERQGYTFVTLEEMGSASRS